MGPVAPGYLKGLARSRQGNLREQALQILKLAEEYGKETVHAAMSHADSFDCYSFSAVQRIIQTQLVNPYALPDEPLKSHESDYFGPTIEVEKRTIRLNLFHIWFKKRFQPEMQRLEKLV